MTKYPTQPPRIPRAQSLQNGPHCPRRRTSQGPSSPVTIVVTPARPSPTARRHLVQLGSPPAPARSARPRRVRISQRSWLLLTADLLCVLLLIYHQESSTFLLSAFGLTAACTLFSLWRDHARAREH